MVMERLLRADILMNFTFFPFFSLSLFLPLIKIEGNYLLFIRVLKQELINNLDIYGYEEFCFVEFKWTHCSGVRLVSLHYGAHADQPTAQRRKERGKKEGKKVIFYIGTFLARYSSQLSPDTLQTPVTFSCAEDFPIFLFTKLFFNHTHWWHNALSAGSDKLSFQVYSYFHLSSRNVW